jgi:hypothetical protein
VAGARERTERDRSPEEPRRTPPARAPHHLLELQRTTGNQAVTRMLARMKVVLKPLREAKEDDKDVVDTATLTDEELDKLITRAATENLALYEPLTDELDARQKKPKYDKPKAEKKAGPGGMTTMKTIYGPDDPLHGLPGLIGPPEAFIESLDKDLASDGIDPDSEVAEMLLWLPANTSDHVELGARISGVYTKLHLTTTGYHLIHNAAPPVVAGKTGSTGKGAENVVTYASVESIPLVNVDARLFYATFLETAKNLGDFHMDTNDCRNFANTMRSTLKSYAPSKTSVSKDLEEDFM